MTTGSDGSVLTMNLGNLIFEFKHTFKKSIHCDGKYRLHRRFEKNKR